MSNGKKVKKLLVRNSSTSVPTSAKSKECQNLKKVHFSEETLTEVGNPTFTAPEFCTLLQLAEEMKSIRNIHGSSASVPDGNKYRNLNFSPEERLYQDLVRLEVPVEEFVQETRSQPVLKLKKDPEVDVRKYTKLELEPEYFFSFYSAPEVGKQGTVFNGHSIYNKLCQWRDED